jgi:outer membrane protein assembly factor BamA
VRQQSGVGHPLPAARSYITSLIGYNLRLDKRNDPIQPTRGWFADLSQDLAGFGGDTQVPEDRDRRGWYWGFNKDFIFSATGSAGYIEGWGGDNIRINDRFYKGGRRSAASRSPVSARATPRTAPRAATPWAPSSMPSARSS